MVGISESPTRKALVGNGSNPFRSSEAEAAGFLSECERERLKEQLADDLTHARYVDLMHALDDHPDLRDRLAKGDFERSRMQEGKRLTVRP